MTFGRNFFATDSYAPRPRRSQTELPLKIKALLFALAMLAVLCGMLLGYLVF